MKEIKSVNKHILGISLTCLMVSSVLAQADKKTIPKKVEKEVVKPKNEEAKPEPKAKEEEVPNLDPPAEVKYNPQSNDGKGIPEIQKEIEKEEPYKSPMKSKLSNDYIRSMLLSPDHQDAVRKVDRLWFADILRIGFQARPRFDYTQNLDFDKRTDDKRNLGTQNSQVWFIVDPSQYVGLKLTIQDVRVFGGAESRKEDQLGYLALSNSAGNEVSTTPTNVVNVKNNTDLREGFVHIKNTLEGFDFYVGRQVFGFGDNRYIGARNDGQTGNSFDGARAKYSSKYFNSEVFTSILAEESNGGSGNNTSNGVRKGKPNDTYLSGLYNTVKWEDVLVFDFYIFNINRKWEQGPNPVTSQDRTRQNDDLNTTGFRITNKTDNNLLPKYKSWDWTMESNWQFGKNGTQVNAGWDSLELKAANGERIYKQNVEYDARFLLLQTGYTFFDRFRVGIQYSFGSGDPNRNDNKVATYDASFATRSGGFPYFDSGNGIVNNVFWSNTNTRSVHLMWNTEKRGRWIFVAWDINKANPNDAWYSSGGTANTGLSTENQSGARFGGYKLGESGGNRLFYEYDLIWQYYLKDYVSIWSGASYLFAGDSVSKARNNPFSTNVNDRYTLDEKAYSFFLFVQFAM
ncbi:MAG: alginate export family protein [Leptospiraceae bacterium]|nr:alginate export family protein [Leptospiraceae bacterium]